MVILLSYSSDLFFLSSEFSKIKNSCVMFPGVNTAKFGCRLLQCTKEPHWVFASVFFLKKIRSKLHVYLPCLVTGPLYSNGKILHKSLSYIWTMLEFVNCLGGKKEPSLAERALQGASVQKGRVSLPFNLVIRPKSSILVSPV